MSDTKNTENESSGLKKSLRLIYVYAIAAGAIFTFIGYWDTIFYEYCGAGTFLGFILMTLLILPIAMVYCELAPLFPRAGGELIYNTVGINKHIGFFSMVDHGSMDRSSAVCSYGYCPVDVPCTSYQKQFPSYRRSCSGSSYWLLCPESAECGDCWQDPVIHAHVCNWRLYCGNHRIPVLRSMEF